MQVSSHVICFAASTARKPSSRCSCLLSNCTRAPTAPPADHELSRRATASCIESRPPGAAPIARSGRRGRTDAARGSCGAAHPPPEAEGQADEQGGGGRYGASGLGDGRGVAGNRQRFDAEIRLVVVAAAVGGDDQVVVLGDV